MLETSGGTQRADTFRRLNAPRLLAVHAGPDAVPLRVQQRGHWRAVVHIRDRWRTEDRWWTDAPVSREYFELQLEDGRIATIFRDRLRGTWQEQSA